VASLGVGFTVVSLLLARVAYGAEEFPPFLRGGGEFPPDVRAEIVGVWKGYTLTRAVEGQPARAPLEVYRLFVDYPDVTAAASRHLGLAKYRVQALGPDRFAAEDGEGATGTYRVLLQEERRRIMLTRGSHEGRILGRIAGASLTILSFEPRARGDGVPEVAQRVEAFVRIDNQVAAFFARLLLPLFSRYADRKVAETFNVTAKVSEWAAGEPSAFCAWLRGPEGVPARREAFAALLQSCR
jgi:hypothetical protein